MKTVEDLVPNIIKLTQNGKLEWLIDEQGHFTLELNKYNFVVYPWTDPIDGTTGIAFLLKDDKKRIVDNFTASQFDNKISLLESLLENARRSANKVDEVISNIDAQLSYLM